MAGKVFMTCAFGGGVGALVALQMWQPLWWVGMLVGGLIGYLTYEFEEVRRAVSQAWRKVSVWRPDWEWWRVFFRLLPVAAIGIPSVVFFPVLLLFSLGMNTRGVAENIVVSGLLSTAIVCLGVVIAVIDADKVRVLQRDFSTVMQDQWTVNAFRIYFWVIPWAVLAVLKSVWLTGLRSPEWVARGAVTIARFFRYLFILVHSEVRLLCGLDAALGATIGYYAGHAGIGALAGGLIGVANFEIVSKRWLKLVPARAR